MQAINWDEINLDDSTEVAMTIDQLLEAGRDAEAAVLRAGLRCHFEDGVLVADLTIREVRDSQDFHDVREEIEDGSFTGPGGFINTTWGRWSVGGGYFGFPEYVYGPERSSTYCYRTYSFGEMGEVEALATSLGVSDVHALAAIIERGSRPLWQLLRGERA